MSSSEEPQKEDQKPPPQEQGGEKDAEMSTAEHQEKDDVKMKQGLSDPVPDPLLELPSPVVREGDTVILAFGDGRQIFANCVKKWRGKLPPVRINKRTYATSNLIGLPYGTVLEVGLKELEPLPDGEDIIPDYPTFAMEGDTAIKADDSTMPSMPPIRIEQVNDNRNLIDTNSSQTLQQSEVMKLRREGVHGKRIVEKLIENSSTFEKKTEFSKAKYIKKKQMKYQPRCRITRCTAATISEALFLKDPRKIMNMRDDTLGQILSYSNISAGCQTLVFETCMGVITGSVAERMGGYGKVISLFTGQQPSFNEMLGRFNLPFGQQSSIKWAHTSEVFGDEAKIPFDPNAEDPEKLEREALVWPCPLQDHTRKYLESMKSEKEKSDFLAKRCARFARKLTRHTNMEVKQWLTQRKCDSVILVSKYDPTATLLEMLPFLAPSSPFVVYCEFIEPLTECFRELQKQSLAINIRLSDTWTREYQILPGRTHPKMDMSQSGGFILTGIKLCPVAGKNELDESLVKEIRSQIGGRRRRSKKNKNNNQANDGNKDNKKRKASGGRDGKRPRTA